MNKTDLLLLCVYAPFALTTLWVMGCLFTGRTDLIPRFITKWFKN